VKPWENESINREQRKCCIRRITSAMKSYNTSAKKRDSQRRGSRRLNEKTELSMSTQVQKTHLSRIELSSLRYRFANFKRDIFSQAISPGLKPETWLLGELTEMGVNYENWAGPSDHASDPRQVTGLIYNRDLPPLPRLSSIAFTLT